MEKVTTFLEKHVQWLALGLGVIYVLWIVYSYVLTPPVTVDLNGRTLTPGEIDKQIASGPAAELKRAMDRTAEPNWTVEPFAQTFATAMNWSGVQYPQMAQNKLWVNSLGIDAPGQIIPEEVVPQDKVAKLPDPPAAKWAGEKHGRTLVQIPQPGAGPEQPNVMAVAAPQEDIDWVTQFFTISPPQIADRFKQVKIPDLSYQTIFLRVDLIRQEQLPDGSWGNETVVPPLKHHQIRTLPAAGDVANERAFIDWAAMNAPTILQPSFYPWVGGDPWVHFAAQMVPGMGAGQDQPVFDPANMDMPARTPEERRARAQYQAEEKRRRDEERRNTQPQPRQPRDEDGGGRRRRPGGNYMIAPEAFERAYQSDEEDIDPEVLRAMGLDPRGGGRQPSNRGAPQPANPGVQLPVSPQGNMPAGRFDPRDPNLTAIEVMAHDDTVEPGKTYRYKLKYILQNPIYKSVRVAANQKDADQLGIESEESQWSPPVKIPDRTNFFIVSGIAPGSETIRIEVFRYQDGALKSKQYVVAPGDAVGMTETEADFATGWTVVDLRQTPPPNREAYIILVNEEGTMIRRDHATDKNNPEYHKLKQEVARLNQPGGPIAGP